MILKRNTLACLALALAVLCTAATLTAGTLVYDGNTGEPGLIVTSAFKTDSLEYHPSIENPIITGNNLYAPDFIRNGNVWNVYYGGWRDASQVNDRIYFAVSDDLVPEGPWYGQFVIIDNGEYIHANDPSVQKRGPGDWVMAYTVAKYVGSDYRDWIAISTSSDGANFSPSYGTSSAEVTITNLSFTDIARPALLWTGSVWKMWFDALTDNSAHGHYLAVSSETIPRNFFVIKQYPFAFGEPDVEIVNGTYVAVVAPDRQRILRYESSNGVDFTEVGTILSVRNPAVGRAKTTNPGILFDNVEGKIKGIAFGMTDNPSLVDHDIGFAYPQFDVEVLSCPDVWHVFTQGRHLDEAVQMTFGYSSFCRIVVRNPVTGLVVADEWVSSVAGDRWRLVLKEPIPVPTP